MREAEAGGESTLSALGCWGGGHGVGLWGWGGSASCPAVLLTWKGLFPPLDAPLTPCPPPAAAAAAEPPAAMAARNAMHGRKFGGRTVEAVLMGETDYAQLKWD